MCQLSCRCAWLLRGSLIICVVTVPNISHNCLYMVLYYPQMYVCVHTLVAMLLHVPVEMDACWKWNHCFQVCHGKVSSVQKASLYCTFLCMSVCLVFSKNTKTYGLSMSTFFNPFRSQIPRQSTGSWGFQCIESPNTKMPLLNRWWYPLSLALSANIGWIFVIIGNLNTEVKLPSICQTGGGGWSGLVTKTDPLKTLKFQLVKACLASSKGSDFLWFLGEDSFSPSSLNLQWFSGIFPQFVCCFGLAKKNDTGKI